MCDFKETANTIPCSLSLPNHKFYFEYKNIQFNQEKREEDEEDDDEIRLFITDLKDQG